MDRCRSPPLYRLSRLSNFDGNTDVGTSVSIECLDEYRYSNGQTNKSIQCVQKGKYAKWTALSDRCRSKNAICRLITNMD